MYVGRCSDTMYEHVMDACLVGDDDGGGSDGS
jgi:hypothetical protein